MHLRNLKAAMIDNQERTKHSTSVSIDENIAILKIVPDAHLGPDSARSSPPLELADEFLGPLVQTEDVTIDVDTGAVGPSIGVVIDACFL